MKKIDIAKDYLVRKITNKIDLIKHFYEKFADNPPKSPEYSFSLYKRHIRARNYINTKKPVGYNLRKYIDIRENSWEMLNKEINEAFSEDKSVKQIVVDNFKKLADYYEKLYRLENCNILKRYPTLKEVCKEAEAEQNSL